MSDISHAETEQLEQGTADKAHWEPPRLSYLGGVAQDTRSNEFFIEDGATRGGSHS
jgi:hypothetical protein